MDLVFSRMLGRFRVLFSKYNEDLITETQFVVLRCLRNRGPSNTSYLAQTLGVTLSAVTALVNRLYRSGLVERERQDRDRRQVWISITPKGLQLLEEVEEKRHLLLALYFSRFPASEREKLLQMLKEIVELFERPDIVEKEFVKWE